MKTTKKNKDRKRIAIYRSNQHVYVQIIDDVKGVTLVSASDHELVKSKDQKIKRLTKQTNKDTKDNSAKNESKKIKTARLVGELLAQKAKKKKIGKAYFDRRHYKYHGRVKALADGAREGGLVF